MYAYIQILDVFCTYGFNNVDLEQLKLNPILIYDNNK